MTRQQQPHKTAQPQAAARRPAIRRNVCYFCRAETGLQRIKAPIGGGLIYACPAHARGQV